MAILTSCVSLPSVREFRRRILISFMWEKFLSTEVVETGNVKLIEAIFCKFGSIVTSISFVMSSLSYNAMLSSGFLASKVRKVIHSVCTSEDMTAVFTCFFIIQGESKLIFPVVVKQSLNWLLSISGKLGRIGTGNVTRIKYGQCWHNIMSCKPAWNVFHKEGYKWCPHCLLECLGLVCTNNFSGRLLKIILGIQKFQNPVCCWSNSIVQYMRTASTREEIMDKSSCFVWRLLLSLALMVKCNPEDKWLQWWWTWIEPCIIPKLQVHGNSGSRCQG